MQRGGGRGVGGLTKQCSSGVPNSEPQLAAGPLSHKTGQASISQVCQTVWRQGRMAQWRQWGQQQHQQIQCVGWEAGYDGSVYVPETLRKIL